jgi:spermidine synthase
MLLNSSKQLGNVLVLDNKIQATEFDEFSYQEMMAFLPLNSHPNPENVLIIGGGDGGVAREVAKHPLVKHITQCEIDEEVVKVSKLYLKNMAKGFDSEKMTLYIGDGLEYMRNNKDKFDVIITDSSDPKGEYTIRQTVTFTVLKAKMFFKAQPKVYSASRITKCSSIR